jgi:hypothetical protein
MTAVKTELTLPTAACFTVNLHSHAVHTVLLVMTVGCSVLSLIPPLRLAGALALRGIACLSGLLAMAAGGAEEHQLTLILKTVKVGAIVIGIIGLALASPLFLIQSLVADSALQIFALIKALYKDAYGHRGYVKAFFHLTIIGVNALVLAAVVTGSVQFMLAAATVSAVVMALMAFKIWADCRNTARTIDVICYFALFAIALTSVMTDLQPHSRSVKTVSSNAEERAQSTAMVYDKGRLLGYFAPGNHPKMESQFMGPVFWVVGNRHYKVGDISIEYVNPSTGAYVPKIYDQWEQQTVPPLPKELFSTVPLVNNIPV